LKPEAFSKKIVNKRDVVVNRMLNKTVNSLSLSFAVVVLLVLKG